MKRTPTRASPAVGSLLLLLFVAGCAATSPAARLADLPFQATDERFDIGGRLAQDGGLARADGLVARRNGDIVGVWLQLLGLDPTGRIVSFSGPVQVYWGSGWDTERFTIALRPRGGEERFVVRVQSFDYGEGMRGRS